MVLSIATRLLTRLLCAWTAAVHVGPWKTGTKTVQSGLYAWREALRAENITPGVDLDGRYSHGRLVDYWAHHDLAGSLGPLCSQPAPSDDDLTQQLESNWPGLQPPTGNVLLSSEAMEGLCTGAIQRLRYLLRAYAHVVIIFVYRNVARRSLSTCGHKLAVGRYPGIAKVGEASVYAGLASSSNKSCLAAGSGGFRDRVLAWASVFGRSSMRVIDFDGVLHAKSREEGGRALVAAVVRAGFPRARLPPSRRLLAAGRLPSPPPPPPPGGAVQSDAFVVLRQLWGPLICSLDSGSPPGAGCTMSAEAVMVALKLGSPQFAQWWGPGVNPARWGVANLFSTPLPAGPPSMCHELAACKRFAPTAAAQFFGDMARLGIRSTDYGPNATRAVAAALPSVCELDVDAVREDGATWSPFFRQELLALAARGIGCTTSAPPDTVLAGPRCAV